MNCYIVHTSGTCWWSQPATNQNSTHIELSGNQKPTHVDSIPISDITAGFIRVRCLWCVYNKWWFEMIYCSVRVTFPMRGGGVCEKVVECRMFSPNYGCLLFANMFITYLLINIYIYKVIYVLLYVARFMFKYCSTSLSLYIYIYM